MSARAKFVKRANVMLDKLSARDDFSETGDQAGNAKVNQ